MSDVGNKRRVTAAGSTDQEPSILDCEVCQTKEDAADPADDSKRIRVGKKGTCFVWVLVCSYCLDHPRSPPSFLGVFSVFKMPTLHEENPTNINLRLVHPPHS